MATQTDLDITQGQTKIFTAIWTTNDVARPITGAGHDYVAHLQARRRSGTFTSTPLIDVSSIDGSNPPAITLEPGGQTGMVRVRIPGALTAPLKRNCWYDLWLINRADTTERVRLVYGQLLVSKSATDNAALVVEIIAETENLSA